MEVSNNFTITELLKYANLVVIFSVVQWSVTAFKIHDFNHLESLQTQRIRGKFMK